ncbi:glutamyl endopeptidase [Catenuloplanes nepalensis]|uniref:Serine protease n=1 Tax=Catenuloplanes nepalensis TaxID=587533 RepID=A0ABT9MKZ5_9ACTN|nr:serine protease [Catenuloplanes nepalensis]MDP9792088.1 glutamyl endopeptidase [Catenuloplanes nepalensis]
MNLIHRTRLALVGVTIGGMLLATAAPVHAAAKDPDTPVSSDGTIGSAAALAALPDVSMVPATRGTGVTGSDGASHTADLSGRPENLMAAQSVIGTDDRIRETDTTWWPASATVQLTRVANGATIFYCTGWLIGPNTVITAGHCVFSHDNGGWRTGQGVRAWPGRNGTAAPYGSCASISMHSVNGWINDRNTQYDYGAIKLDCTVGNTVGTYGFRWQSASLNGTGTSTRGYPGDKPDGEQWASYDQIRVSHDRELFYHNDTVGGQSGSPIYTYRDDCGPCGLAVHAYGLRTGGSPPFSNHNRGTRITEGVFTNFQYWNGL